MREFAASLQTDFFNPHTLIGSVCIGALFLIAAMGFAALVRRATRQVEAHLSDVTGLSFASAFGQVFAYVVALILYAHLIPDLRALGHSWPERASYRSSSGSPRKARSAMWLRASPWCYTGRSGSVMRSK